VKHPKGDTTEKLKIDTDETNISAIEQKEKKQTWFQGKNGNGKRSKSTQSPPCERPEKTYRIRRTEA
jgi:hypothetical protein